MLSCLQYEAMSLNFIRRLDDSNRHRGLSQKLGFRRSRKSERFGEFCSLTRVDGENGQLIEELSRSFEDACPNSSNSLTIKLNEDRIFLALTRPVIYRDGLNEVLSSEGRYGISCPSSVKSVTVTSRSDASLTAWRCKLVSDILQRLTQPHGPDNNFDVIVSCSRERCEISGGVVVFVGSVSCSNVTSDECERAFKDEVTQMGELRISEDNSSGNIDALTFASMTFALFNGNISKNVNLHLKSISSFCKGAIFVHYNHCRLAHIVHKYQKLERVGTYPALPEIGAIDFSLLTKGEEWDLMFNYVIRWPTVVESATTDLRGGIFKVHKIFEFLKSLASAFSSYYRKTRILTEPRPNLLPVLQARIYLILGLLDVYRNALESLGFQTVHNM